MCCASLRGSAYFCSSIHITLGAVLFIRYVIVTAFLTFFNVTDVIKDRITGYLLPFVAYITLFLAFGIVIFHSVEKEYFIILRWATLGFSLLQLVVLVALYTVRFVPASTFEYRQFPFLPVSITEGYVNTGFQTADAGSGDPLSGENYYADNLPKLTRSPDTGVYPTSATGGVSAGGSTIRRQHHHHDKTGSSSEVLHGLDGGGGGGESGSELDFIHPVPTAIPNKWLGEVYSLIALIVMTCVSLVYLVLLFIYVRQLTYEDSGHVFGHAAQSVTRNVAFYVQPQFAQSGNSDNKLTNSPSPALRNKALHSSQQANCTQQLVSNTHCQQIPSEFLPQPQNQQHSQQARTHIGNHLKPGSNADPSSTTTSAQDTAQHHQTTQNQQNAQSQQQQQHQSQNQSQNHIQQRSPVPPAREMQQNIQSQQQQQVITIYPQKGGGFTSSSSSPRMQVKFAKPLEQEPNVTHAQPHFHGGDAGSHHHHPEPQRSILANPGSMQHPQNAPPPPPPHSHMMPPPPPPRSRLVDPSGRSLPPPPGSAGGQFQPMIGQSPVPPPHQHQHQQPIMPHQHQQPPPPGGGFPPSQHIQGQPGPSSYTHHQQPPQPPPQHMPYHGKGRAQQQTYNDMVDNSSYLVFSGNPNSSNMPPSALHPSHLASASHTYPHCSQRRPSGSMV